MKRTHFHLLLAAGLLSGCSKEEASLPNTVTFAGADLSKGVIAYSTLTSNNPFFNVISSNLEAEAKAAGYDVQIVSGDEDAKKQSDQIKDFIAQQVAAIVLNPCDSSPSDPQSRKRTVRAFPSSPVTSSASPQKPRSSLT